MKIFYILIATILVNNFVLHYFLGICPFLGVSTKMSSAIGMGFAATFVMTLTALITWLVNHYIIIASGFTFLQYVAFILVIASLVQFVEMFLKKFFPALYRALGIYLPLITTNCAILGLALLGAMRKYNLIENIFFGFGAGIGFTLALVAMAGIREELEKADIPEGLKGVGIALITAGLMSFAFLGFAGIIK